MKHHPDPALLLAPLVLAPLLCLAAPPAIVVQPDAGEATLWHCEGTVCLKQTRTYGSVPLPVRDGAEALQDEDFIQLCRSAPARRIAQALRDGASPNAESDKDYTTPIIAAARANADPDAVRVLLAAGANADAQDDADMSALMYAARYNSAAVVRALLDAGADRSLADKAGHDALWYARQSKGKDKAAIVRLLEHQPAPAPTDNDE